MHVFIPPQASDHIIIEAKENLQTLRIFDAMGKTVIEPLLNSDKSKRLAVDVNRLPPGLYFVQLKTSSGMQSLKFVKAAR